MTDLAARKTILALVDIAVDSGARQEQACAVISMSVRTLQRWRKETDGDQRPGRVQQPRNRLDDVARQRILAVANSAEFGHLPPSQIVPRLADQGSFIGSESTFYRVLREANQVRHRSASRPAVERSKPRALSATQPNELYSWDITYLPTTIRGVHFYLYLFLDIYSRKIVGWQVYDEERSDFAAEVISDICAREKVRPGQVVLHSDNGSPMKGASMLATLQRLGVVPSLSRPAVSNDNPFSESVFKTLKYRSDYPERAFEHVSDARQWVSGFVDWYNNEHRHSAIRFVTPAQRHAGLDEEILRRRHVVYTEAKARHPYRWSKETRNWTPVTVVYLNPAKEPNRDCQRRAA
jgi:putative transposase